MTVESVTTHRARAAGAIAGALIGIVPSGVGLLEPDLDILVPAGILGAITGAILGARYGPRVRSRSRSGAIALGVQMAVLAVLLGDMLVCLVLGLAAIESTGPAALPLAVLLMLIGLAAVGLPALGLALVAGFAWVLVMRIAPARWLGGPA